MALENYFLSPQWVWALLAVIPLIILYLLRPRPQKQTIPSLMFLMRDKKKKRLQGFLQKFVPSLLLLLQLLIILALATALMRPYMDVPLIQSAEQTIIVLDDSASMHARDSDGVRYETAVQRLTNLVGDSNTVILAGSSAEVVMEDASREDVKTYLSTWQPSHQPTHLRVALQEALSRADSDTAVIVASDFIDTEPQSSPQEALSALRSTAGELREIRVGETNTDNIGIIDVQASDLRTTVVIKNFDTQSRETTACVAGVCRDFILEEQETQEWTFSTPQGISEVLLETGDSFPIDDKIYIGSEQDNSIDVLVVTNGDWQQHPMAQALEAIDETSVLDITTTINTPPQISEAQADVVIFSDINAQYVVERTFRNAEQTVREGGASIVLYQEGLFSLPYESLLDVSYVQDGSATPVLNTNVHRSLVGINYGSTPSHYLVEESPRSVVLARGAQEQPLITLSALGSGRTMYYGLAEQSSFSTSPDYPLFWKQAIDTLLGRMGAQQKTLDTGSTINLQGQVQTPTGESEQGSLILKHTGAYRSEEQTVVANLNNAAESAISVKQAEHEPTALDIGAENSQPEEFTMYLLIGALALMLTEIIYLKYRGDV